MRYPASEKLEIIRLVEQSHLPTKQTIDRLGVPRTTFYRWYDKYLTGGAEALEDRSPKPSRVWNRIPDDIRQRIIDMALDEPELSPRELAVRFTDTQRYFVSEASVYRLLKAHDLITSPAFVVIKAAEEFRDKTTAINQMLLSAMLRIACRAKGRRILPTSRSLAGVGTICRPSSMTTHATLWPGNRAATHQPPIVIRTGIHGGHPNSCDAVNKGRSVTTLVWLDFIGVGLFAATGALVASRKQIDIIGFVFLGTLTGIGGGTLRDLILGVPVFWIEQHHYILVCVITSAFVYLAAPMLESRYKLVLWLDTLALAAYGVFGAAKSLLLTGSPVIAVVMGMMTGTVGGILRDVVAGEPSVLMRREIYISAALVGALTYVALVGLGLPRPVPEIIGFAAAFGIRAGALLFGWALPQYRPRPGRHPDDI
jgi:uncharacterized membrane protein YeiH/transposase-like protein